MAEKEKKNLHDKHRERMRIRFSKTGFNGWHKHEVLEYMLYHVFPRGDTNKCAHSLLNYSAGSMSQLFEDSKDDRLVKSVKGVSSKTVAFLRHLKAFIDYYKVEELKEKPVVLNRNTFRDVLRLADMSEDAEDIVLMCLDGRMRVRSVIKITDYSDNASATARIENIIKFAAQAEAVNVVLVHNHPSGSEEISEADRQITDVLDNKLRILDIFLVDHYIVCGDKIVSIKMTSKNKPAYSL